MVFEAGDACNATGATAYNATATVVESFAREDENVTARATVTGCRTDLVVTGPVDGALWPQTLVQSRPDVHNSIEGAPTKASALVAAV